MGIGVCALCMTVLLFAHGQRRSISLTHSTLRYEGVAGQTTWYTCGAAAVATLLTYTFEIVTTEADVMEWFEAQGVLALEEERGLTALNLRDALEAWGVPVRAFRVTLASLADFFERGGLPVIAHVTVPQRHFVVLNGLVDDQVLMADPSWGSSMAPLASLDDLKGFSGVVLVPVPTGELLATGRARQLDALAAAGQRLERLERLREVVP